MTTPPDSVREAKPVAFIWRYASGEEEVVFVDARTIQWDQTHHDCPTQTLLFDQASLDAAFEAGRQAATQQAQTSQEIEAVPVALRVALENLDSTEPLGPTTEAVVDAAQRWYLATPPGMQEAKGLSDEQIEAGYRDHEWSSVPHPFRGSVGFERGVKFAEARHGIGPTSSTGETTHG